MRTVSVVALIAAMLPLAAQAPKGFQVWKSSDLKGYAGKLSAKLDGQKVASQPLADWKDHLAQIAYRTASGEAEYHERAADIFVIESGGCSFIVGGKVKDGRTTAPGEIRGPSIEGGETRQLSAGDIVHIPARTAHQMILPSGGQILYFVVKVNNQ